MGKTECLGPGLFSTGNHSYEFVYDFLSTAALQAPSLILVSN